MRNSVPSSHSTPSRRDRAKQNRDKWILFHERNQQVLTERIAELTEELENARQFSGSNEHPHTVDHDRKRASEVSGAKAVQMAERSAAESKRLSERLEKALSGERQKFHEVNQELEKIKKEMAQIEQRLHDEKVARVHSEQELETLKIEMQRKDDRLMQTQAQLHCLEEEYKDLQQQTKESRIALEECSKQLVDEKTNKATACREVERLAGKVNYLEDKIQKDEDDYHRQHAIAVDTLQKELDGIKVGAKRELEKLKDELRKTKADAYSKISSLEEQKSALQAQLVEQCSAGGESDHSSMSKDAPSVASTRKVSSPISETKCLKTVPTLRLTPNKRKHANSGKSADNKKVQLSEASESSSYPTKTVRPEDFPDQRRTKACNKLQGVACLKPNGCAKLKIESAFTDSCYIRIALYQTSRCSQSPRILGMDTLHSGQTLRLELPAKDVEFWLQTSTGKKTHAPNLRIETSHSPREWTVVAPPQPAGDKAT